MHLFTLSPFSLSTSVCRTLIFP
uniref:Uncharacterized protein n=1 Tax=Anguilla anguilla TaxID=7936 RepID=A0A0E9V7W8_ANGAN